MQMSAMPCQHHTAPVTMTFTHPNKTHTEPQLLHSRWPQHTAHLRLLLLIDCEAQVIDLHGQQRHHQPAVGSRLGMSSFATTTHVALAVVNGAPIEQKSVAHVALIDRSRHHPANTCPASRTGMPSEAIWMELSGCCRQADCWVNSSSPAYAASTCVRQL
jgi:hypothetical protein